jgi:uncharacterized membrane protein
LKTTFKTYFFTGILVIVPLAVTYWLFEALILWVDDLLAIQDWSPVVVPGIGLIIGIFVLLAVGALAHNIVGRWFLESLSKTLNRVPLVGAVYGGLKEILHTAFSGSPEKKFGRAVLVEYPKDGCWTIAFVTKDEMKFKGTQLSEKLVGVYVPTTPNPTSGFFLMFPREKIIELSIGVDEAFKSVVSLGMASKQK